MASCPACSTGMRWHRWRPCGCAWSMPLHPQVGVLHVHVCVYVCVVVCTQVYASEIGFLYVALMFVCCYGPPPACMHGLPAGGPGANSPTPSTQLPSSPCLIVNPTCLHAWSACRRPQSIQSNLVQLPNQQSSSPCLIASPTRLHAWPAPWPADGHGASLLLEVVAPWGKGPAGSRRSSGSDVQAPAALTPGAVTAAGVGAAGAGAAAAAGAAGAGAAAGSAAAGAADALGGGWLPRAARPAQLVAAVINRAMDAQLRWVACWGCSCQSAVAAVSLWGGTSGFPHRVHGGRAEVGCYYLSYGTQAGLVASHA